MNTKGKLGCKITLIILSVLLILGIVLLVSSYDYIKSMSSTISRVNAAKENPNAAQSAEELQLAELEAVFKTVAQVEKFKGQFKNEDELINFMVGTSSVIEKRTGMEMKKLSPKALQMQSENGKAKDIIDFVYIFKKVPNCSLESRNCYVYVYKNVKKGEDPKRQSVVYYDRNGKFEIAE